MASCCTTFEEVPPELHQLIQQSFVDAQGFVTRDTVIEELNGITVEWVEEISQQQVLETDSNQIKGLGARVVPFGGHAHRIVLNNGDIDAVCLVPKCLTIDDFLDKLAPVLQKHPKVSGLKVVRGARVPIINLVYMSIEVDLCYAVLNMDIIPDEIDFLPDHVLNGMDATSCRSLNGIRATKELRNMLPDLERFSYLLKIIKLWAEAQGIHNSTMGFLGGMAWSILVAKICLMYPDIELPSILMVFFSTFSQWEWPKPVLLAPLQDRDPFNLKPWNPRMNRGDTFHVMPIIKPSYPEVNCSAGVTKVTRAVMIQALRRASALFEDKSILDFTTVSKLLTPFPFISSYRHFLLVQALASREDGQGDWSGLVASRIKLLMSRLESLPFIQCLHPWAKAFPCTDQARCSWLTGIHFMKGQPIHLDISDITTQWQEELIEIAKKVKIYKPQMTVCVQHVRRLVKFL